MITVDLSTPSVEVSIDRDRAAALGVTTQQIETALGTAFGGERVSPIYTQADQYWVILELLPHASRFPLGSRDLFVLQRTATAYLPTSVDAYLALGFTQFTLGVTGPRWELGPPVEAWLAWRDGLNRT